MLKIGLTLGKFAPLHKGHQHVIETMLSEMDESYLILYDSPETIEVPFYVRKNWIEKLYPSVKIIEAWNGPEEMGETPEIKSAHEKYILQLTKGLSFTHFYSSEFYGDHVSRSLGAVNRLVDPGRTQFPISGTKAREDYFQSRNLINPIVYRDLVKNIVFMGSVSTGKTTLCEALAKEFNTVWMPEYGREYWEKHQVDKRLTSAQLVEIAEGHIEREEKLLLEANRFLFTDTNAITTYMFALYYHGYAEDKLKHLAKECIQRYDFVFVCDTDIPYDDTWDRSGDVQRKIFQKQIISDLKTRKVKFTLISGSLSERVEQVKQTLLNS